MKDKYTLDCIKVCIVIPCYNEEQNLNTFYLRLKEVIAKYDYSVIFIDDGSSDQSLKQLRFIAAGDTRVSYLILSKNFGQQNAIKAGYDYVENIDCVISMDADLQHPPQTIDAMIKKWMEGFDIVNTLRCDNKQTNLFKKLTSRLFYSIINFIGKNKIIINSPDYRLLDRKVVEAIKAIKETNFYLKEIISWVGYKQAIVPFVVNTRLNGKSKYTARKMLSLSIKGITAFSINPLRLSSIVGGIFSMLSFLYALYAIYGYLFSDKVVPGWTSLIVSILFIAGIQFILMGIIGEYLGKTFLESKRRPMYIISEAHISSKNKMSEKSSIQNIDRPHLNRIIK